MMKKILVVVSVFVFAVVACKKKDGEVGKQVILSKIEVIQGTTFSAGSSVEKDEAGLLKKAVLGADQKIADVSFGESFPYVFKKGTELEYRPGIVIKKPEMPSVITIKEKHVIMGIEFPAETRLEPASASGTVGDKKTSSVMFIQFQLGDALTIKGKTFKAGEYIQVYSKDRIVYHENGKEKTL